MTILENSKILIYDFHYNVLKKVRAALWLIYKDTESLLLEVQREDFYKDMGENTKMFKIEMYKRLSTKPSPLQQREKKGFE